jgi:hypothetical protein
MSRPILDRRYGYKAEPASFLPIAAGGRPGEMPGPTVESGWEKGSALVLPLGKLRLASDAPGCLALGRFA